MRLRFIIQCYLFFHILFFAVITHADFQHDVITLELKNSNLPDAIRLIAQFMHMNVIISPSVRGTAALSLQGAMPEHALNMLLISHGLAKWRQGNVWLIAPQVELIKLQQDELKWQDVKVESAPLHTQIWQIKYAKAGDLARLLQDEHASLLSKRGRVRVDTRTNMLCIQDVAERIVSARQWLRRLDVPSQQISIEARLVSIDSDFERDLGIQFLVKSDEAEKTRGGLLKTDVGRYSLAVAKLADGSLLDVKLSALENAGHAELISSPSLFTANQQPASIEAGEEVPYQEVSESGGTAVVFKKAVLGLKVTPQILPKKNILLQLQINQDRPSNKMVQGMPTISTRQMSTRVLAKSGQTIVLGGIYETNTEHGLMGFPFVNQVPILRLLFQQHNLRKNKRELLIFVTPRIVQTD